MTYLAFRVTTRAEPGVVSRGFKLGQTVSASMVALAHGTNDAQKTMGVITLTLITAGMLAPGSAPPFWVVLAAGLAIALGTYMGGWRIIRTLGRRVSDIHPVQGFTAETTSAAVILTSTHLGLPLSTTQVCTGSIFGAGAGRRLASVHWGVAGRIVLAWSFTLPAAAVVGARGVVAGRDRHRRRDRRRGERAGLAVGHLRRVASQRGHRGQRQRRTAATGRRRRRLTTRGTSSVHIDWATLAAVAVVAAAAALTVVLLVAFALVGLSARSGRRVDGPTTASRPVAAPTSARPSPCSACSPPGSSSATACT